MFETPRVLKKFGKAVEAGLEVNITRIKSSGDKRIELDLARLQGQINKINSQTIERVNDTVAELLANHTPEQAKAILIACNMSELADSIIIIGKDNIVSEVGL